MARKNQASHDLHALMAQGHLISAVKATTDFLSFEPDESYIDVAMDTLRFALNELANAKSYLQIEREKGVGDG